METACDKHVWILGYTVHPGNEYDSHTFKALYDKIKKYGPDMLVADTGYRTPAIAHELIMEMKAGLTFVCMNLKKLAKILEIREGQHRVVYENLHDLKKWIQIENWYWRLSPAPNLPTVCTV